MYGWVCVACRCHKLPSPVVRAPLLSCRQTTASKSHAGLTKPSQLHAKGPCNSANYGIALAAVILWCGWTTGGMPSFGPIQ